MIKQFVQGTPSTESELCSSLGSMVLSKEVHDKLGNAVNSRVGDIWWVVYDTQGARMGFAQGRVKNSDLCIRYLYAVGLSAHSELISSVIEYAKNGGYSKVFSGGNSSATGWRNAQFQFTPTSGGGTGIWERKLGLS